MAKTSHREGARTSPAFQLLRQALIHIHAKAGVPTMEIAKSLKHSRSFIIKQVTMPLKPRTASERHLLKMATEHAAAIQRMGLKGLLGGEDITTTLAGGERPKLGTLAERKAKAPKPAKAPKKAAAPKPAKAPKKAPKAKPEAKAPAAKKAKVAAPSKEATEARRAKKAKVAEAPAPKAPKKAKVPKAPPVAPVEEAQPSADAVAAAGADDLLADLGIGNEPDPAAPV